MRPSSAPVQRARQPSRLKIIEHEFHQSDIESAKEADDSVGAQALASLSSGPSRCGEVERIGRARWAGTTLARRRTGASRRAGESRAAGLVTHHLSSDYQAAGALVASGLAAQLNGRLLLGERRRRPLQWRAMFARCRPRHKSDTLFARRLWQRTTGWLDPARSNRWSEVAAGRLGATRRADQRGYLEWARMRCKAAPRRGQMAARIHRRHKGEIKLWPDRARCLVRSRRPACLVGVSGRCRLS